MIVLLINLWLSTGMLAVVAAETTSNPAVTLPYVQRLTPNGATICWLSRGVDAADAAVETGPRWRRARQRRSTDVPGMPGVRFHQARVDFRPHQPGLTYRLRRGDQIGPEFSIRRPPGPKAAVRALIISDLQNKPLAGSTARAVLAQHRQDPFDLILAPGDFVDHADDASQWFNHPNNLGLFDLLNGAADSALLASVPIFPAIGNHDISSTIGSAPGERSLRARPGNWNTNVYETLFVLPRHPAAIHRQRLKLRQGTDIRSGRESFYAFRFGNLFVASLFVTRKWEPGNHALRQGPTYETPGRFIYEPIGPDSPQYRWLARALRSRPARTASVKLVMLHHPIFSQGENIIPPFGDPPDYAENYLVERLAPLLTEAGVDLVINGHNHVHGHYRWNGVHYFEASMFGNSYGAYGVDAEGNPLPEPHGAEMISWHRLIGETAFAVLDTQLPTAVTSYRVRDGEIKDALETFTLPL